MYHPSWVEIWTFIGTFGFFLMLFSLFLRFLPVIAIAEIKGVLPEADPHHDPAQSKRANIVAAPVYDGDQHLSASEANSSPVARPAHS